MSLTSMENAILIVSMVRPSSTTTKPHHINARAVGHKTASSVLKLISLYAHVLHLFIH